MVDTSGKLSDEADPYGVPIMSAAELENLWEPRQPRRLGVRRGVAHGRRLPRLQGQHTYLAADDYRVMASAISSKFST